MNYIIQNTESFIQAQSYNVIWQDIGSTFATLN